MKSPAPIYRTSLSTSQSSLMGRFLFSLVASLLMLTGAAALLAHFAIPSLIPPKAIIRVISSPPPQNFDPLVSNNTPRIARPVPQPPVQRPTLHPTVIPTPIFSIPSSPETSQLLAQSEEALLALELFEEEETQRVEELQRKELVRQKAAEEKELERKRQEKIQQLAARAAEQKRAQEKALAARETEARQALARKEAQKKAAAAQANRIATTPTVKHSSPPPYPSSARRSQKQGTTQIAVTITSSGKVSSPRILKSSGHRSLDSSALAAVKKWRFNPAKNGLGQPVAFQMTIPVTFRLK